MIIGYFVLKRPYWKLKLYTRFIEFSYLFTKKFNISFIFKISIKISNKLIKWNREVVCGKVNKVRTQ